MFSIFLPYLSIDEIKDCQDTIDLSKEIIGFIDSNYDRESDFEIDYFVNSFDLIGLRQFKLDYIQVLELYNKIFSNKHLKYDLFLFGFTDSVLEKFKQLGVLIQDSDDSDYIIIQEDKSQLESYMQTLIKRSRLCMFSICFSLLFLFILLNIIT